MPLGFRVITEIKRPPADVVTALGAGFSADLADSMNKAGAMQRGIAPLYQPIERFAGPAVTATLPTASFTMAKIAMEQCRPGDVLVLNCFGDISHAMFGGHLGLGLKSRGVVGVIVDGAVRDVSELREVGLPVFARGTSVVVGGHDGPGEINVPIACGGVVVNPGDIIVADEDGVVSVPQGEAEYVLTNLKQLKEKHAQGEETSARGEFSGIAELIDRTRASGCEYL